MELEAHRQQRCDSPVRYVLIQNKDKLGGLNQFNFLRILNLLALVVESIAFFNIIYYLPAFVFIAFHFLGFVWSFLYQIFPSLSTSLVFKLFAHLFSTVYMMVGMLLWKYTHTPVVRGIFFEKKWSTFFTKLYPIPPYPPYS